MIFSRVFAISLSIRSILFIAINQFLLLSIYKTGSRQGLIVAMNAALPFMDGEMRGFAARTLSKVEAMTEAEFAGLPIYAADEV